MAISRWLFSACQVNPPMKSLTSCALLASTSTFVAVTAAPETISQDDDLVFLVTVLQRITLSGYPNRLRHVPVCRVEGELVLREFAFVGSDAQID